MKHDFDSKDTYLIKDDYIIGIHAIGYSEPYEFEMKWSNGGSDTIKTDFNVFEIWGNKYDKDLKMQGGSFRINNNWYNQIIQDYLYDGWEIYVKETN